MSRAALRIEVAKKDQKELEKMLSGGVQPVRAVLRAMALQQLAKGISAPRIAPLHSSFEWAPKPTESSSYGTTQRRIVLGAKSTPNSQAI
jgi:hypothetical protein